MHFYLNLFLSFCLLYPFSALSQQSRAGNVLFMKATNAFTLSFKNADSALQIATATLAEAEKEGNKDAIAESFNTIGWALMHKGQLDSSVIYLQKSLQGFKQLAAKRDILRLSINLSEVLIKKSQLQQALHHLLEGDSVSVSVDDLSLQTDIKRLLGIVYRESGDNTRSTRYFMLALNGFEQQKDYYRYITTSISLSILYRNMGIYDSSLAVLDRTLLLAKNNNSTHYHIAMIEENTGETYFSLKRFPEALQRFQRAYDIFKKLDNKADLAFESFSIGKTLKELGRYHEAETYLLQAYQLNETLKTINYQADASTELASLYESINNWKQAHFFLQKATALKDSIKILEQIASIAELKEKYESEKQEQEIVLLKTQHDLSQSQTKRAELWKYIFILLFVAAMAIAWLLAYKIRIKKKLEHIKEQERIAYELEDERILNQFAMLLYGKNTIDDISRDIINNCRQLLGYKTCWVYRYDEHNKKLIQVASSGIPEEKQMIFDFPEIIIENRIANDVASTGKPVIITDTYTGKHMSVPGAISAIAIPILIDGKVFGVIESEDERRNFYNKRHLHLLQKIAAVCAERLTKLLAEEKLRNVIARDIHDEMGSTLTSIHVLSNLVAKSDASQSTSYLERIREYSGKMLESMNDIIWTINPQYDTVERLLLRMKEFSVEMLEPAGIACNFQIDNHYDAPALKPEERKFLYLIFKESLNNIVKYSKATTVSIMLDKNEKKLFMVITDNGIGFEQDTIRRGNGLRNMQTRAEAINATLVIQSGTGRGTVIRLEKSITS